MGFFSDVFYAFYPWFIVYFSWICVFLKQDKKSKVNGNDEIEQCGMSELIKLIKGGKWNKMNRKEIGWYIVN